MVFLIQFIKYIVSWPAFTRDFVITPIDYQPFSWFSPSQILYLKVSVICYRLLLDYIPGRCLQNILAKMPFQVPYLKQLS
jgi:hypothetical protein